MTSSEVASIGPTERVRDYTARFEKFFAEEVLPLQEDLASKNVGTPSSPALDDAGRMHPEVWNARREIQRRSGAANLYAPHIAVEVGGAGFSRVEMHHVEDYVYRTSGLGLGLAALAWTEGPYPAMRYASKALRDRYLSPLIRGEMTLAFANTEHGAGTDVLAMKTHAKRNGGDWINGRKAWITNAHFADILLLVAVTDQDTGIRSLSMFVVDASEPGVRRGPDIRTKIDDGLTGEVSFVNVRVPAENLIGEVGDGFALAMTCVNWRRLCRGGMCSGWGQWLIERAIDRAKSRKSGGRPIAEYQAIQHLLAQMDVDVYQARATSLVAQAALDGLGPFEIPLNPEVPRLVSLLKTINDEAFFRVADKAVQIHGGMGLLRGSPEEKLFRVARNLRIPAGTTEIQLNAIARGLLQRGRNSVQNEGHE